MAILYTAQMVGLSFANLIAAGVFQGLDGVRGLAGWRWYVFIGALSILPHLRRVDHIRTMMCEIGCSSWKAQHPVLRPLLPTSSSRILSIARGGSPKKNTN